jgi:hypothetical protein
MAETEFGSAEGLDSEETDIASLVSYVTLADVLRERQHWLQKCSDMEEDYVD